MPIVEKRVVVPFSAQQMFALVADVQAYPQFVPWCVSSSSRTISADAVEATLKIGKGAINTSFTTRNELHPYDRIVLGLVKGPFKRLRGEWHFESETERSARVSLRLEFEISNPLIRRTVGPLFDEMARRMVGAFEQRARQVYG